MPRKAKPPTEDVVRAREALQAYLNREDLSVNKFASSSQVGQPCLSRFLTGVTKSVTPHIAKALSYAGIHVEKDILRINNGTDNARLLAALARNWDGSDEEAEVLALLIEALGPVLRSVRAGTGGKRK